MNIIYSLQLLRFFAAISVVLFHMPVIYCLSIGVDIFFVISGFVIALVLEKSKNQFFLKRIIRILPLYWLLTIFIFIMKINFPSIFSFSDVSFIYLLKSLFFFPIYSEFDNKLIYPIIMVGWTLNYEIFFYLIAFISILISKTYYNIIIIFILFFLNLIGNYLNNNNFFLIFVSDTIILEFALGIVLFLIYKTYNKSNFFNNFITSIIVLILALLSFYFLSNFELRIIYYGIPSFFIVLLFIQLNKYFDKNKKYNLIGLISYCIYLIHPYFLSLTQNIINYYSLSLYIAYFTYFICFISIILISSLVYLYIENKIINFFKTIFING